MDLLTVVSSARASMDFHCGAWVTATVGLMSTSLLCWSFCGRPENRPILLSFFCRLSVLKASPAVASGCFPLGTESCGEANEVVLVPTADLIIAVPVSDSFTVNASGGFSLSVVEPGALALSMT